MRFEDGVAGEVELGHLVGRGFFGAWTDIAEFEAVTIDPESGTVVWPHRADLAPDALHREVSSAAAAG